MVENSPPPASNSGKSGSGPLSVGSLSIAQLVEEHHAVLYRYAYRLTGSVADAEDLSQQVFLIAQEKVDQVRQEACVRGWLFAVLRNAWFKRQRKRQPVRAADLDLNIDNIAEELPSEVAIDPEQVQAAINELADEFKSVLLLFYFENCSYREIAKQLDLPLGTVMSRLSRAKGHLRARLFEPELHGATSDNRQSP